MENKEYLNDKKEFIMLDFFRIIGAALVVSIHIAPFADVNPDINFWLQQILARLAVPFFFTASGYFLYHTFDTKAKFLDYIKRISLLYILYTILYLPQITYKWLVSGYNIKNCIISLIKNTFISGSFTHLWYFLALIIASILLYTAIKYIHLSDKCILITGFILYGIGVLGEAYQNLFLDKIYIGSIMKSYYELFTSTRNGLFFGFFLVSIGYMIHKYSQKIPNNSILYFTITLIMFFIMNREEYWASAITHHKGQDMIFTTPLVIIFLFLTIACIHTKPAYRSLGLYCRKLSVLIYGFHLFVKFYLELCMPSFIEWSSWQKYLLILSCSTLLGIVLIQLQKKRIFNCIKYLF